MADQNTAVAPPPPPGFQPVADSSAAPSAPPPPPGFSPLQTESPEDFATRRHLLSRGITNPTPEDIQKAKTAQQGLPPAPPETGLAGVGTGIAKGAAESISGATALANKVLPSGAQIPDIITATGHTPEEAKPKGIAEGIGNVVENIGEFAGGEEALKGITSFMKLPLPVIQKMEAFPKTAKAIMAAVKAGTVGAAQGAVKGAASGEAGKGAIEGGVGGAVGAGATEGVIQNLPWLAKLFGVGGLSAEEALTKAGRPAVSERNWSESVNRALPLLVKADEAKPFKTMGELADLTHDTANNLWKTKIAPMVAKHGNEVIDGRPIALKILQEDEPELQQARDELFPGESKSTADLADKFQNSNLALSKADAYLRVINAKLKNFYKMSSEARAALGTTDAEISGLENAGNALRESIYSKIDELETPVGPQQPGTPAIQSHAEARKQYGALKDIERVLQKSATVADRQKPLNIQQILTLAGGLGEMAAEGSRGNFGAAAAGAIPFAVATANKVRQSGDSLARQGINAAAREMGEGGSTAVKVGRAISKVGDAIPHPSAATVGAAVGANAPRELTQKENFGPEDTPYAPGVATPEVPAGHLLFRASDSSVHLIPVSNLEAAKQVDPNLQVLQQK